MQNRHWNVGKKRSYTLFSLFFRAAYDSRKLFSLMSFCLKYWYFKTLGCEITDGTWQIVLGKGQSCLLHTHSSIEVGKTICVAKIWLSWEMAFNSRCSLRNPDLLCRNVLHNKQENRNREKVSRSRIAHEVYVFNEISNFCEGFSYSILLVKMRSTHANTTSEFTEAA